MNYTLEPLAADAVSEALELLLTMHRIRFLEEKISELRRQGDIQGSVHLCIGQEAIYAGKESIDPELAFWIVMESAIPMSKVDLANS
mgnify:CR=1 FL=1